MVRAHQRLPVRQPLSGHGETFAEAAWEAGIDPRWSPAISNTESTKGRVCFKSHNAWGWDQIQLVRLGYGHPRPRRRPGLGYGFTISYSYAMRYCPRTTTTGIGIR